jgi:hypothetical protein
MNRFSGAFLGVAVLAAAAFAQDGFNLKRVPKVGDAFKYNLSVVLDVQGQEFNVTATVQEKITKVEDGKYTVESTQSDLKLNGQDAPMEQTPSLSTYSSLGRLLDSKSDQGGEDADRIASLQSFEVPDRALKVGDTWEVVLKAKEAKNPVAFKGTYKVEAQEKVGKWDTLKISFTVEETEGSTPAKATGFAWFSISDQSMVKYEAQWENAPFPSLPPVNAKVALLRIE